MAVYNNPIVLQRADPWVLKVDGEYYFTGSDPEYNCIAIRHASNVNDLQKAPETVVWRKHESGPASIYIWAPELHRINGAWYIYFAGAATDFEASGLPTHRMFVLENTDDDPTTDNWVEKGQIVTPIDSFALDATTEVIDGVQYLGLGPERSRHRRQLQSVHRQDGQPVDAGKRARHALQAGI